MAAAAGAGAAAAAVAAGAPGHVLPGQLLRGLIGIEVEALWKLSEEPPADVAFSSSWAAAVHQNRTEHNTGARHKI